MILFYGDNEDYYRYSPKELIYKDIMGWLLTVDEKYLIDDIIVKNNLSNNSNICKHCFMEWDNLIPCERITVRSFNLSKKYEHYVMLMREFCKKDENDLLL